MLMNAAKDKGKNVMQRFPIRVDKIEAPGLGIWKHQAAVCPASQNAKKVMPAKVVAA